MRKNGIALAAVVTVFVLGGTSARAGEEAKHAFVGVAKCKMCHKTEAQGSQYDIWLKSPHAKAYETLAGDEAKAIAKEKGIDNPQTADACLKCHVTGHGVAAELLGDKYEITDGVGCESCHGAGGDYYKKSVMEAVMSGETEPASVGLVIPDEKTCTNCHNPESPSYKEFDFEKMVAQIKHTIPEERKAKYKK